MTDKDPKDDKGSEEPKPVNKNKRYRKDKPWDTDDIDHWAIEPFDPNDERLPKRVIVEESSFAMLFPKYREQYLKEVWPHVTSCLNGYGVACELDLVEGSMKVKTTRKTRDPYSIIKARDMLKLLSRSVPFEQAIKIMQDDVSCDIIKIGGMVRNKERFAKRRQRLVGPNGNTLKAIELLTGCYVLVQGTTVSCMGPFKGLKQVRRIVLDCMNNVHPIYAIKTLMIKRELAKDPTLKDENWDRFLPKFKRQNVKKKSKPKTPQKAPKEYTPFPPPQQPRKEDLEMESGVYFLSASQKAAKKKEELYQTQKSKMEKKKEQRKEAFVAPEQDARHAELAPTPQSQDIHAIKNKLIASAKSSSKRRSDERVDDYVQTKKSKN